MFVDIGELFTEGLCNGSMFEVTGCVRQIV